MTRIPSTDREITLRATHLKNAVPGEIVVVRPERQWIYARRRVISGEILSARIEVSRFGLVPLRLENEGMWDPEQHYWGDSGGPIEVLGKGNRNSRSSSTVYDGADIARS